MHVRVEKAAAWAGLAMTVVFMVALGLIAGVIPPFDPAESAAETAHRFSDNQVRMQIGLALMILFAYFYAPFFALLARQVRRIEGYWGVMSVTQILVGVVVPFGFALCAIFAAAAAFRVDRSPEVTQGLSDIFWFIFVGLVGPFLTQTLVLAFAIFMDGRTVPSFPR